MIDPSFSPLAFLMDLDGVLVHSHEAHVAAYREAFRIHGLVLDPSSEARVRQGTSREGILAQAGLPEELVAVVSEAKEAAFLRLVSQGALIPAPGVGAFLEQVRRGGCRLALVSASAKAGECVASLGMAWAFDTVVDGTMVERSKPDPEPWLLATSRLGVSPSLCITVEDSSVGASGARAAGTFVVGVGPGLDEGEVDALFPDLMSIPLGSWLAGPSPSSSSSSSSSSEPRP
ncbi:HAD family hydrolase [Gemmatimonadota bacterium]